MSRGNGRLNNGINHGSVWTITCSEHLDNSGIIEANIIISPTPCSDHSRTRPAVCGCQAGLWVVKGSKIKVRFLPTTLIILPAQSNVTTIQKDKSPIGVCLSIIRLDLNGLFVTVYRCVQLTPILQGISHIVIGISIIRLNLDGLFVTVYRCG